MDQWKILVGCGGSRNAQCVRVQRRESPSSVTQPEHCGIKSVIRQALLLQTWHVLLHGGLETDKFLFALFPKKKKKKSQQGFLTSNIWHNRYRVKEVIRIQPIQGCLTKAITGNTVIWGKKSLDLGMDLLLENVFPYPLDPQWKWCIASFCPLVCSGLPIFDMTASKDANTVPDLKNDSCHFKKGIVRLYADGTLEGWQYRPTRWHAHQSWALGCGEIMYCFMDI